MAGTPVSLFVHPFGHTRNTGHVSYRLQFIYCNITYNIWTSTQYYTINNNTNYVCQQSEMSDLWTCASDGSCLCAGHRWVCNFILDLSGSVLKWPSLENLSSTIITANIRYQNPDLRPSVNRRYRILQDVLRQILCIFYILILRLYFNCINFWYYCTSIDCCMTLMYIWFPFAESLLTILCMYGWCSEFLNLVRHWAETQFSNLKLFLL
jgi:hypothetical protein